MSRGFLMFAYNNEQIDYGLLALCNGLMIKNHFPDAEIALVSDEGTIGWLRESRGNALTDKVFDHLIVEPVQNASLKRRYLDTLSTTHELPWHNSTRSTAYDLSPFDETILLDSDYLICSDVLSRCWGSSSDLRMNHRVLTLNHEAPHENERRLEPFGISMYWATCMYFRKSEYSKIFFDLVSYIRENYDYYQHLYRFPGILFRNDYVFSIAAHIMAGMGGQEIEALPQPHLMTSFDCDELMDVPSKDEFLFLVNDTTDRWKFTYSRLRGIDVHVMNKFSIGRNADKIIALYGGLDGA